MSAVKSRRLATATWGCRMEANVPLHSEDEIESLVASLEQKLLSIRASGEATEIIAEIEKVVGHIRIALSL